MPGDDWSAMDARINQRNQAANAKEADSWKKMDAGINERNAQANKRSSDMPWRTGTTPPTSAPKPHPDLPPVSTNLKTFAAGAAQSHKSGYSLGALGMGGPANSNPTPPKPPALSGIKPPPTPKPAAATGSALPFLQKKAIAPMQDPFMSGFTDEIIKTAAIAPMVAKVKAGATMLGRKVKSMASRVAKRAKGMRMQTKGGAGMKGLVSGKKKMAKKASVVLAKIAEGETDDASAQDLLQSIMDEAQARMNDEENEQGYSDQQGGGAEDPSYGTGTGKKAAKRSMTTPEAARARR